MIKKKIKELTVDEMNQICRCCSDCDDCPLNIDRAPVCLLTLLRNCALKEKLETEIEINEYS